MVGWAADVGRAVAGAARAGGWRAVYLASSDLTHYGPAYGYDGYASPGYYGYGRYGGYYDYAPPRYYGGPYSGYCR